MVLGDPRQTRIKWQNQRSTRRPASTARPSLWSGAVRRPSDSNPLPIVVLEQSEYSDNNPACFDHRYVWARRVPSINSPFPFPRKIIIKKKTQEVNSTKAVYDYFRMATTIFTVIHYTEIRFLLTQSTLLISMGIFRASWVPPCFDF